MSWKNNCANDLGPVAEEICSRLVGAGGLPEVPVHEVMELVPEDWEELTGAFTLTMPSRTAARVRQARWCQQRWQPGGRPSGVKTRLVASERIARQDLNQAPSAFADSA